VANDELPPAALPKLYGAPAYSRPPRPVAIPDRPIDPDDLPIAAVQTDEERHLAQMLDGQPYAGGAPADPVPARGGRLLLRGRPFRLRAIADRFRSDSGEKAS